jgi:PEP-CTERM motif
MKLFLIGIITFALMAQGAMGTSHASIILAHMAVDNSYSFYISTSDTTTGTLAGIGSNWLSPDTISTAALTPGVVNYLHITAYNDTGTAGFLGDFTLSDSGFTFANGSQYLLTNAVPNNWFVSTTDYGINVSPVTKIDPGINGFYTSSINQTADTIWASTTLDAQSVYFSTAITPTVPEPSTYLLLCISLGAVGFVRKKLYKRAS